MGGIMNYEDAIAFMLAGAGAIAIGTGNFINPNAPLDVLEGMKDYMKRYGYEDVSQITGDLKK